MEKNFEKYEETLKRIWNCKYLDTLGKLAQYSVDNMDAMNDTQKSVLRMELKMKFEELVNELA